MTATSSEPPINTPPIKSENQWVFLIRETITTIKVINPTIGYRLIPMNGARFVYR